MLLDEIWKEKPCHIFLTLIVTEIELIKQLEFNNLVELETIIMELHLCCQKFRMYLI